MSSSGVAETQEEAIELVANNSVPDLGGGHPFFICLLSNNKSIYRGQCIYMYSDYEILTNHFIMTTFKLKLTGI